MKKQRAGKIFLIFGIMLFSIFLVQAEEWGYDSRLIPSKVSTDITILQGNLTNFTQQQDTPSTYNTHADECVTVKNDETGLEFTSCASAGDTNETTRVDTIVGTNCGTGNYSYGFDSSGNIQCREDVSGGAGGNIFDQVLNISSNITHNDATFTGNVDVSNNLTATNLFANLNWNFLFNKFSDGIDLVWFTVTGETLSINQTTLNATIDARAGGDNSSWNESYADTKYLQSYTETDPLWSANYSLYNTTWSTDTDTTYSNGTGLSLNGSNFFSILLNYMLPQSCNNGEIAEYNTTSGGWDCAIDNSASSGMSNWILAAFGIGGSETITDGETVTLGSGNDYIDIGRTTNNINYTFNETRLNETIDSRDSDTTYTHLTNFTDDLGHIEDNSSWNESYADTLYADISVTGDNSSWNESHADTQYLRLDTSNDPLTGDLNLGNHNITNILRNVYNVTGCEEDAIEGTVCWNSEDKTLNIVTGMGNVIQVGQEIYGIGFNVEGSEVADGSIVAMYGAQGDRPTFILADGSNISRSSMVGVVTTTCSDSTECPVTTFGYVRGIDTSSWSAGTKLYMDSSQPGNFTSTIQTLPNNPTWVATVLRSHASTGIIFVFPRFDPSDGMLTNNFYATGNITVDGMISMVNFSIKRMDTNGASTGDLFAICMTGPTGECLPHLGIQPGGPGQGSFIARSLMIVDEEVSILNNTNRTDCQAWADHFGQPLKIDCNTTTTGADLFVGDDLQVNGDVWLLDSDGEFHFMTRELALNDELRDNSVTSKLNISLTNNNLTLIEADGDTIAVVIDENTTFLDSTDSILLTTGTNTTPIFNTVYYNGGGYPTLLTSTTEQLGVADVAQILMGANYSYGSIGGSATGSEFIRGVYRRFYDDGALYQSGFNIDASTTELNFTTGTIKVMLDNFEISENHSTENTAIEIHNDGTFHQHIGSFDNFDAYSDGGTIGNNRYFNVVCGIAITIDEVGRMYCITQNEPIAEFTSSDEAEQDSTYVQYFPQNTFVKKLFVPVARIVVQRSGGVNTIQTLSSTDLYFDLRGRVTGAGAPPVATIDTNTNIIDDALFNVSELEEQADSRIGIIDSFIELIITNFVDASFVNALFADDLSIDQDSNLSEADVDAYADNNNYLDLDTYPNADTDSTNDFNGAWNSLTGVPAGFSDDVDNDSGSTLTHLSNFTDDLGHIEDNSSWNESHADTKYLQSYTETDPIYTAWDNFTGIPTATPSNGDTTHLSTADQIYDWVIGLGYSVFGASVDDTEMTAENFGEFTCTGAEDGCTLNNDALDDQYYDSEADLTGLLDDNYVNEGDDQDSNLTEDDVESYIFDSDNTANLPMTTYNITMNGGTIHSNSTCLKFSGATTDWEIC